MTTTPAPALTTHADDLRAALVELLTTGQHHHAATPTTLTTIGHARQALATQYHSLDPAGRDASYERRLAALTHALGGIGEALFTATAASHRQHPDPTRLHTALTDLAAISLGWLDILPDPTADEPPF